MKVAVVGAGIVGAATARALARRGVEVELLDAGEVSGGTTGLGEGNVLCSDKDAGPELELAVLGLAAYDEIEASYGERARIRRKGALVVHRSEAGLAAEPRADRAAARGGRRVRAARARPGARARAGPRRNARRDLGTRRPPVRPARDHQGDGRGARDHASAPTRGSTTSGALRADHVVLAAGPVERRARPHGRPPPAARAAQGPARPARGPDGRSATRSSTAATWPRSRPPTPRCRSRPCSRRPSTGTCSSARAASARALTRASTPRSPSACCRAPRR